MSDYWRDDESGMEEIDFCLPFSAPSDIALIPYHARGPLASDITTPALSILEHPQVPEYFDVPDYCCTDPSPPSIAHVRQLDQFEHVQQQPDYRFSILGNAYSHIWPDGAPDTLDSQRDAENSIMQTPIGNFECNALPDHTTFLTSMGQYPASVLALCPQQITMEEQRSSLLGEGALTASQINAVTDAIGSVRTEDDAAHSILSLAQSELNASPKASVSNAR
ncbi:MAG: hypothetical protein M1827_001549 [Pycnora praestabilis]|nr:MAG: hypothetical protein M1827_001549 [Pycnora praestabilis]